MFQLANKDEGRCRLDYIPHDKLIGALGFEITVRRLTEERH